MIPLAGYRAGQAFLQIVASLSGLQRQINRETRGLTATINAQFDDRLLRRQLGGVQENLRELGRSVRITVSAEGVARTSGEVGVLSSLLGRMDGRRVRFGVDADVVGAVRSVAGLALAVNRFANKTYSFRVEANTAGAVASVAAMVGKVSALTGAAGIVGGFGGALAGLAPAGASALAGIIPVVTAFNGVGEAYKALSDQQKKAVTEGVDAARKSASAAAAVESAELRVAQAARSVAQARRDGSEAIESALRDQQNAQRDLRAATQDLDRAQTDLTYAWEEGRRSLQDLQDQIDGNALDQRQATLDLADARDRLAEAQAGGDPREIARAQLAVDRQVESMDVLAKRAERARADNAQAQAAGIAGTQAVVAANENLAAARDRVSAAERSVVEAQRGVDQAREQAAERIQAAQEGQLEAQRALTQALASQGDSASASADKVTQALGDLSAPQREFALYLFSLKPLMDDIAETAAGRFFPSLQRGMGALVAQGPALLGVVGNLSGGMGSAVELILTRLADPRWMAFYDLLGNLALTMLPEVADIAMLFAEVLRDLLIQLVPLAPAAFDLLRQLAGLLQILAPFIVALLSGLIPAASAFLTALTPLGPVLAALQPILLVLGEALASVLGPVLAALAPILVALTPLIELFARQLAEGLVTSLETLSPLLLMVAEWMGENPELVLGVIAAIGGLLGFLKPLAFLLGIVVSAFHSWLVIRLVQMALVGLGLQATLFGRVIMTILSPINLLRMALPLLGRLIMWLGRTLLAAMGPIGWIITGLSILYSTNEEFRNAVNGLLPILGGLVSMLVGALMPAFNTVIGAISPLIPLLMSALVPIIDVVAQVLINLLSTVLPPLVEVISKEVIPIIATLANILAKVLAWIIENVVIPIIQLLAWVIANVVAPTIVWLYEHIVKPAFERIGAFVVWVWQNLIKPALDALIWLLTNVLGPAFLWLWETIVKPYFTALGEMIKWVWEYLVKPAFDAIGVGLDWLGRGFDTTVRNIGDYWNKLRNLLAVPINFMIGTVFNNGIRKAWNFVADLLPGIEPIGELPLIPEFARGGVMPGYTPGRDPYVARVSGGEAIMRPEWTRVVGPEYVDAANRAARQGGRVGVEAFLNATAGATGAAAGKARLNLMQRYPLDNGYAYGGVVPHVAAAGQEIERLFGRLPGGIGGVGARANASDHPRGLALDFMTLTDRGLGDRIVGHMLSNARRLLVKYIIWQQQINEGGGWRGMEDRGSPTANHMDHPHVSFLSGGEGRDFSNEGGFFDWIGEMIRGAFTTMTDPVINSLEAAFPAPPQFHRIPAEAARMLRDGVLDFLVGKGNETMMPTGGGGDVQRWSPLVSQALTMMNLPQSLVGTTLRRMNQESGGNPRAINNWDINAKRGTPSKGLMQVIDPTFRAYRDSRAPNDVWDPLANVLASMRYALARYGSLPAAYDRAGGYDSGGWIDPGSTLAINGTRRPEAVLTAEQWGAVATLAARGTRAAGDTYIDVYPRERHDEVQIARETARVFDFEARTGGAP